MPRHEDVGTTQEDPVFTVVITDSLGMETWFESLSTCLAMTCACKAIVCIGSQFGLSKRVTITNSQKQIVLDWRFGLGFVRPRLRPG